MPIELGIWRLGDKPERIEMSALKSENDLESLLAKDISILSPEAKLLLLGQQVPTAFGKRIDLLAMDSDGNLVVIELKRDRTPRDVVAQLLDYAAWVQTLSYDKISSLFSDMNDGKELEEGFADVFDSNPPEKLNQSHQLIVVAAELDPSTERIIDYLSDGYGVPINAVFFHHFKDEDRNYLARTWLIDPREVDVKRVKPSVQKASEPWNGRDFYVAIGVGTSGTGGDHDPRTWEDCRKYGFVAAGGSRWASKPLKNLFPGARVFAYIPGEGYIGVGVVKGSVVPVTEFRVEIDGQMVSILEAPTSAKGIGKFANDPDRCEYLVPVEWTKVVERGYREKGMFAIQTTVCPLRNRFTLDLLIRHFELDE